MAKPHKAKYLYHVSALFLASRYSACVTRNLWMNIPSVSVVPRAICGGDGFNLIGFQVAITSIYGLSNQSIHQSSVVRSHSDRTHVNAQKGSRAGPNISRFSIIARAGGDRTAWYPTIGLFIWTAHYMYPKLTHILVGSAKCGGRFPSTAKISRSNEINLESCIRYMYVA